MFGDETGVPPLAPIVTTPVPLVMTAFVGLESVTLKLRDEAAPDRSMIGTTMFSAVCPGPKVSVPLVVVKSVPDVAEPLTVV